MVLYIIPGVESVFWRHIVFFKYERSYIACGNLMVKAHQKHYFQKQRQNKTGSVLTVMT